MLSTRVPDLDSLELLLAVATEGSLGRAGAVRGISQPAASARIRRMEGSLGFPLLHRTARGSTLTPAGALVAHWARDVIAAAAVLDAGIGSLREDAAGRLRIAASLTIAEHLLPHWLVRLSAGQPGIAVSLSAVNSDEVARQVLHDEVDLGFVEGPTPPSGLSGKVIGEDRLVVVVPPGHPWTRRRKALTSAELATTRLVHREPGSGTRTAFEVALAAFAPLPTPLLELGSTTAVRSAVAAGAGPAVLSDLAVRDDVANHRLVEVAVSDLDLRRRLRAVWPAGQRPSGPARDLLAVAARSKPSRT
ncbi:MAG: hypothetical protein QOG52_1610 [Frankiaceae bacterium]|nr:hypothetical protein [Frankiaceae bacterium]